jgi:hypothetical protein
VLLEFGFLWDKMADEIVRLREALANYPEMPERSTHVTDKVVEAADYFCSYQGTASEGEKYAALNAALDDYRAAVAAETCERSSPITAGDTQGDK